MTESEILAALKECGQAKMAAMNRRDQARVITAPIVRRQRAIFQVMWMRLYGSTPTEAEWEEGSEPRPEDYEGVSFASVSEMTKATDAARWAAADAFRELAEAQAEIAFQDRKIAALEAALDTVRKVPLSRARTARPVVKLR